MKRSKAEARYRQLKKCNYLLFKSDNEKFTQYIALLFLLFCLQMYDISLKVVIFDEKKCRL